MAEGKVVGTIPRKVEGILHKNKLEGDALVTWRGYDADKWSIETWRGDGINEWARHNVAGRLVLGIMIKEYRIKKQIIINNYICN